MFVGVVITIAALSSLLGGAEQYLPAQLHRRGLDDPGHFVLEGVLVVSAGFTLVAFVICFFCSGGREPGPDRNPDLTRRGLRAAANDGTRSPLSRT